MKAQKLFELLFTEKINKLSMQFLGVCKRSLVLQLNSSCLVLCQRVKHMPI